VHVRTPFLKSRVRVFRSRIPHSVTSASPSDVRSAVHLAHSAYREGYWSKIPVAVRSSVLSNLARMLEQKIPEFAKIESMQTGRCIKEMNAQLGRLPEWL